MAEIGFDLARVGAPPAEALPGFTGTATRTAFLSLADAASVREEWAGLAARAAEANNFFHPDFALPAAARLGHGVEIMAIRAADGGLIAAAPVVRTRLGRVAPALRLWSHDYGPLGVPLLDRDRVNLAASALIDQASGSLILPDMSIDGPVTAALLSAADRAGRSSTIIGAFRRAHLARNEATDLRAAQPTRRRKEFARQMRRLADSGEFAVESVSAPDKVRARFEEFLLLEAAGWKGRGGTALISSEKTRAFARDMLRARAEANAVRIDSLRIDRRPVAMVVTFIDGDAAWTWKIAHDEKFARFSPGAQVMLDLPSGVFADPGIRRIDSLASAGHPMIDHLWPGRLAIGTIVIGPKGNTAVHRIGLLMARAEIRARAAVRQVRDRLKRRGGNKESEA